MPLGRDCDLENTKRDLLKKRVAFEQEIKEDTKGREWYRILVPGMKPMLFRPDGALYKSAVQS